MDTSSFARGIGESIVTLLIMVVIIAFALGFFAAWALPKLWMFLKPLIHAATA
jgi:hypothetical protein